MAAELRRKQERKRVNQTGWQELLQTEQRCGAATSQAHRCVPIYASEAGTHLPPRNEVRAAVCREGRAH